MSTEKTNSTRYRGVGMITSVPLDTHGKPDLEGYRRVVQHQIAAGIGLIQCPLADELYYFTDEECASVMKALADSCKGRALSCAIASHSPRVEQIIANARRYESLGVDIIKVLCPLHYGMDFGQEDVYGFYATVAEAVRAPIMIYNQPRRAGVNVAPTTMARLVRKYPHIALLEETNFNQVTDIKSLLGEALSIYVKYPFWLPASVLGCDGMYSWQPYAPDAVQALSALCLAGRYADAATLFYRQYDLFSLTDVLSVAALKFGLEEIGFAMGGVRAPVPAALSAEHQTRFRAAIGRHVKRVGPV